MLAYNKTTLHNLHVREEAQAAFETKCISVDEYKSILESYPSDLYTPNLFVKIGLGFLTVFIVIFTVGLLGLIVSFSYTFISGFTILCGMLCYGALEVMVNNSKHFNSGVDNILSIASAILILTGIGNQLSFDNQWYGSIISLCTLLISAWFAIRFINSLMGVASFIALLCFIFFTYTRLGQTSQTTFPILLILASVIIYYITLLATNKSNLLYHRSVLNAIHVVSILAIYTCGNFYFVNELIIHDFNLVTPSYMVWFCWAWTMAIPVMCVVAGLRNKNITMARIGIILVPVSIITFRYYHAIMPAEVAMTTAGTVLIVASYLLIRYLRQAKHGYTFDAQKPQGDLKNLEGFIIGEAFGNKTHQQPDTKFGGGSFGGAGAGDSY